MKKNEIKQLTDVQHILQRSGIYLGSIQPVEQKGYFYNEVENKFEYKDFTYVPAFCKIINEIIDNALDEAIRTNFKHANEIHVTVTKDTIKVSDNGRGVPCDIDSTGKVSQLELAFCNARAGSNFDDSGRNTIGMNGVGSFCTNCFSTLFKVNSDEKKYGIMGKIRNGGDSLWSKIATTKKYPSICGCQRVRMCTAALKDIPNHRDLMNFDI